jgi:membrane-bound lytic murein transglycosylase MltF
VTARSAPACVFARISPEVDWHVNVHRIHDVVTVEDSARAVPRDFHRDLRNGREFLLFRRCEEIEAFFLERPFDLSPISTVGCPAATFKRGMDLDLGPDQCGAKRHNCVPIGNPLPRKKEPTFVSRGSGQQRVLLLLVSTWLALVACKKHPTAPTEKMPTTSEASSASRSLLPNEYGETADSVRRTLVLPLGYGKRTGDLDEMVKERVIRALVIIDPIGFFYLSGRPHGIQYESLQEFEKFANQKLKTGKLPVRVVFLPMRPDQVEAALTQGVGDFIAHPVVVTPEREQRVTFSVPIQKDVSQVVVTGSALASVSSFDSLTAAPIYVNPLTAYYDNLKSVNGSRLRAGKPPLNIQAADKQLYDDDLIEMVNARLIPATVTRKERADLWAQVLPNIKAHPELVIAREGETAWVMRKNTPRLKQLIDGFLKDHAAGTTFGNTLLRRYLQNTRWIQDSLSPEEFRKFIAYSEFFKKYAAEYNFDYLMIAAQGYQESQLDQARVSPAGAVGVMQVIPKLAAAHPINIPDVGNADGNIHAGAKMLHNIIGTYFNDSGIDNVNKTLFTFASYDSGPTRIAHLQRLAPRDGLDPNQWFENVELEVAKDVGEETVIYVGNIYKYYVAYRWTADERKRRGLPISFKLRAGELFLPIYSGARGRLTSGSWLRGVNDDATPGLELPGIGGHLHGW